MKEGIEMTEPKLNEVSFIQAASVRESYIGRVEVLDRVGGLLLLPNTEFATTKQVAEYFGVPIDTIKACVLRNKREVEADGVEVIKKENLLRFGTHLETKRGGFDILDGDKVVGTGSNKGITLFPKRAILRVAMLLRDSEVAKEIRTRLLDIVHDVQKEAPQIISNIVNEIVTEQSIELEKEALCQDLAKAIMANDTTQMMILMAKRSELDSKLLELSTKRLEETKLELTEATDKVNILVTNSTEFSRFPSVINRLIRDVARVACIHQGGCWNRLYAHLDLELGIRVVARQNNAYFSINRERQLAGKKPYSQTSLKQMVSAISTIKEEEFEDVLRITKAWAIAMGLSASSVETAHKLMRED